MYKPDIHPGLRVRRAPANPDNVLGSDKPVKPPIVVNLDMPTETVKSDGRLPLPVETDISDNKYEGLDSILSDMECKVVDPLANWTFRTNNPETDEPNKQVTTVLNWTIRDTTDGTPERPKRLTYAQMAQPALIRAKRDAMRIYRDSVNITRTGQGGTKQMGADIPVNLDTNDATSDIAGTWHKFTRTVTMQSKVDNRLKQYTTADMEQMSLYRASKGNVGELPEVLDPVNEHDRWGSVTSYGSARKGPGGRILTNQTNSVMRDGKWQTRTNTIYAATVRFDPETGKSVKVPIPGKGHILVRKAPEGTIRTLDDFGSVEIGHLPLTARFMPYGKSLVKVGERLTSDNLGIRHQDGKSDISGKVLELDGTNIRVKRANSDNARKRHEKAKSAKAAKADAKAAMLAELSELARKVHDGQKAPFAPMTRAERDILRDMG